MLLTEDMLKGLVKSRLSKKRCDHSFAVAECAVRLAEKYGVSKDKAYIAAMLHDITKEDDAEAQLQTLSKYATIADNDLIIKGVEKTYHQLTGALYAENVIGVKDEDVLNAIKFHTTGRKNMSLLEQIIFVADGVSEDRDYPEAEQMRKTAFEDLNQAIIEVCAFVIVDRIESDFIIHPKTIECYNWCISNKENKNDKK